MKLKEKMLKLTLIFGYVENIEWNGMEYRIFHGKQKLWNGI
jgi:hypothetical protein